MSNNKNIIDQSSTKKNNKPTNWLGQAKYHATKFDQKSSNAILYFHSFFELR